ncbi:hypothetical protein NJB18091_28160 [Mycobacterium marinum]|nr:hypothetical protein NJB18091_28160 [Mycobacterium marinum]
MPAQAACQCTDTHARGGKGDKSNKGDKSSKGDKGKPQPAPTGCC